MIQIVDNFLSEKSWNNCLQFFRGSHWTFPPFNGPTNQTSVWRIFNPIIESSLGEILYAKLQTLGTEQYAVKRVGINGATALNESHIHVDGPVGNMSLVWFASPIWRQEWAGGLQIFHDEECWKTNAMTKTPNREIGSTIIEYIPNRAVLFPSHLAHIPETPSFESRNNLRVSVGLHLTPSNTWNYQYIPRINNGSF